MARLADAVLRPLAPALETARHYSPRKLGRDVVAGVTVAAVELPQAMAYALLAGVPPQYGVYASVIQGVIAALLSSGEHLATGPTNTQALLVASAVTRLADPTQRPELYLQLVAGLAMLKGAFQVLFAVARFGELVRFVSRSVIVGVAAGAGILIVIGQLPAFLGLRVAPSADPLPGVAGAVQRYGTHLGEIDMATVAIGAGCLAIVAGARAVSKLLPGALLAIAAGAVAVWGFGLSDRVATVGALPGGLPDLWNPWPGWRAAQDLVPAALALAALGLIETVAIGKTMATGDDGRVRTLNPNRESFAQGAANLAASVVGGPPGSGSFTRSALAHDAGGATRFAMVVNAVAIAAAFWLISGIGRYVPLAALAAVLLAVAWGLIDWRFLSRVARTSRGDAAVCLVTLAATLLAPLEWAVFIGIFVNIALYLRTAARLHLAEMIPQAATGSFVERPAHERMGLGQPVVFLQLEGELFFAVADELHERLSRLSRSGVKVVILRLKRTHGIDATILHALEDFVTTMRRRGGHVVLCGVRDETLETLRAYGLVELIGTENVFGASIGVWGSAKKALQRARELVGTSRPEPPGPGAPTTVSYEI